MLQIERNLAVALVAALALAGCANKLTPPSAKASAKAAEVPVGAVVELDGSESADTNTPAQPIFFRWAFKALPAGSAATLNNPTLVNPSFVADVPGAYTVVLVVANAKAASEAAEVLVTAGPCGASAPTIARITPTPENPGVGTLVQLAAEVADADLDAACGQKQTLTHAWSIASLPAGSRAALNQRDATNPSLVTDVAGEYRLSLVVTDSTGRSSEPEVLTLTVTGCGGAAPSAKVPTADPAKPNVGQTVQLSVEVTDADNQTGCDANQSLAHQWFFVAIPAGSAAAFNDPSVIAPSFLPDLPGDYLLRVRVTDSTGLSTLSPPATVTVATCGSSVPSALAPTADPASPTVGQTVQLSVDATDADNLEGCDAKQTLTYQWFFVAIPAGSQAALNDASVTGPSFVADLPGDYQARVRVTDSTGRSSLSPAATVTVSTCGSAVPSAEAPAADPASPNVGQMVELSVEVTDADNLDGCEAAQTTSYQWFFVAIPAGSRAALNDASVTGPSFVADLPGDYTVRVKVTDSTGRSSLSPPATITASTCGGARPTVEEIAASPAAPNASQVVQLSATVEDADALEPCEIPQTFTYQWAVIAQPAGSLAALNNAVAVNPSFAADLPGDYTVSLVVTDGTGLAGPRATFDITVSTCGSAAPVATIQAPAGASIGATVQVLASVADADTEAPCDQTETYAYRWSFDSLPSGSRTALNAGSVSGPSFVPDVAGDYLLRLVVLDAAGHPSAPASANVTVNACGGAAPTVLAQASPAAPNIGQAVSLEAVTDDPDNATGCEAKQTFRWAWSFDALPAGSKAALNSAGARTPSFAPDLPGDYLLRVVASDSTGRSSANTVKVTASSCGGARPSAVVSAGVSSPAVGQLVGLSAVVTDADNGAGCDAQQSFAYAWAFASLPAGSRAGLNDPAVSRPSFAPDVPGDYVIRLVVTDSTGRAGAPATVTVTAGTCGTNAPSATVASQPGSVGVGMAVKLVPTVADGDADPACAGKVAPPVFDFRWTLLSAPARSLAALSGRDAREPSFVADVAGNYEVLLAVSDQTGLTGRKALTVSVDACGSNAPTVNRLWASPDTAKHREPVRLEAEIDDADNGSTCQNILGARQTFTYHWRVVSAPAGSRPVLIGADNLAAAFEGDLAGTYTLWMTVTDSTGRSAARSLSVVVTNCGSATPTVSPSMAASSTPRVGGAVLLLSNGADADNTIGCDLGQWLTYRWWFVELPRGSQATLGASAGANNATFSPDVAGQYVIAVVAQDPTGRQSVPVAVSVTASACGGNVPVARATRLSSAVVNTNIQVDALNVNNASSDADNDAGCALNQALSFQWEIFAAPASSTATIQPAANASNPWFRPNVTGTYVLRLWATDSTGRRSDATALTIVIP